MYEPRTDRTADNTPANLPIYGYFEFIICSSTVKGAFIITLLLDSLLELHYYFWREEINIFNVNMYI